MIFIINNLKYDTDKMEKICEGETWVKCMSISAMMGTAFGSYVDAILWKSKKGNFLLTYENKGRAISEEEAKRFMQKYSLKDYERFYGEIEEA